MVSPENTHTGNTAGTQQVIFGNNYACTNTYSYGRVIDENRGHEPEEVWTGVQGGLGGGRGKENAIIKLQSQNKHQSDREASGQIQNLDHCF